MRRDLTLYSRHVKHGPFASTPAARTKDTVIWSFNGQNCSFYNLNWINCVVHRKTAQCFALLKMFFTLGNDRLFPSVKNILNKENILYVRHFKHAARGPLVVCGPHDNTNVTHIWPSGDPRFDMPALEHTLLCELLWEVCDTRKAEPLIRGVNFMW
jgi:hypothetical protein